MRMPTPGAVGASRCPEGQHTAGGTPLSPGHSRWQRCLLPRSLGVTRSYLTASGWAEVGLQLCAHKTQFTLVLFIIVSLPCVGTGKLRVPTPCMYVVKSPFCKVLDP